MIRFFQENGVDGEKNGTDALELDCDGDNFEMIESMRIYIERYGRPDNYLESVDELNERREDHLNREEAKWR